MMRLRDIIPQLNIRVACALLIAMATQLGWTSLALADGGQLQISRSAGPWIVSLFTSPSPTTVGPVDISVLVQTAETQGAVADATIQLIACESVSGRKIERQATSEAATNKLFQAAILDIPRPGHWTITAIVRHEDKTAEINCELWVSSPPPPWSDMVIWIGWPLAPIGLYVVSQVRAARSKATSKILIKG